MDIYWQIYGILGILIHVKNSLAGGIFVLADFKREIELLGARVADLRVSL
jgi:hypothetical protein